ncbi:hypothetical protein F5148DRAFT_1286225 [Russula earlei]|uniref:Uncharacterized protein n=1 Tax=Russula earlei TaxID=71964 RepID=A0ACC0U4P9_9AGAM|nr:hypothetical protein F5148DRAFT_1286225 [Russula earlei]
MQKISVASASNVKVLSVGRRHAPDSSLPNNEIPQPYYILRDNRPITIRVQVDSTIRDITLQPRNSFAFWANIYFNYGIGMLVDREEPKRYGYRPDTYIFVKDSAIHLSRFPPMRKGTVNLSLSLPFTTFFNMQQVGHEQYRSAGLFGIEAGVDYAYATNRYLSLRAGAGTDALPLEYLHFGPSFKLEGNSFFASLRNNYVLGSFDLGYGISVSKFNWSKTPINDSVHPYQGVSNISAGLSLNAQYRFGKHFRVGILYQPGLLNTSFQPAFEYQHYISFNLTWSTYLMLRMIADYATFQKDIDFLKLKQEYIHIPLWITAFYVHVFTSIIALLAGFTQFSNYILQEHKQIHRIVGRVYAWDILLINFPAGMIMAVYANGYLPTKIAFVILDSLWFLFTWKGVVAAKQKRFAEHRQFMIRSYALTFSAITLRMWKIILSKSFPIDPVALYMIDAWMGFVPNLLVAEWLIRRERYKKQQSLTRGRTVH